MCLIQTIVASRSKYFRPKIFVIGLKSRTSVNMPRKYQTNEGSTNGNPKCISKQLERRHRHRLMIEFSALTKHTHTHTHTHVYRPPHELRAAVQQHAPASFKVKMCVTIITVHSARAARLRGRVFAQHSQRLLAADGGGCGGCCRRRCRRCRTVDTIFHFIRCKHTHTLTQPHTRIHVRARAH